MEFFYPIAVGDTAINSEAKRYSVAVKKKRVEVEIKNVKVAPHQQKRCRCFQVDALHVISSQRVIELQNYDDIVTSE